jgi:hypothetical protein
MRTGSIGRLASFAEMAPPPRNFVMAKRIVTTPTNARTGTKEGVVRYVLGISIALVIVLFAVGYLFH